MAKSESFSDFISQNGIVATTAGITIGFATATFVKSLAADIFMPLIFMALAKSTGKASFFAKFLTNKEFLFTNFVSELITWVLIVLTAWVVLDVAYKYLLNTSSSVSMPAFKNPFGGGSHVSAEQKSAVKPPWELFQGAQHGQVHGQGQDKLRSTMIGGM